MENMIQVPIITLALSVSSPGQKLSTTFAGGNGIGKDWGIFFDVNVEAQDLTVTGLEIHTGSDGASFSDLEVYTRTLGAGEDGFDFSGSSAGWQLASTGSGDTAGSREETPVTLGNLISLGANSSTAFAIVAPSLFVNFTSGNGSNEFYSNRDLSIRTHGYRSGSGGFGGLKSSSRVWNGSISYTVETATAVPEPSSSLALAGLVGLLCIGSRRR